MRGQLIRLFNTARHLRWQQACGQIRRRIAVPSGRLTSGAIWAPAYPGCRWSHPKDFLPPATEGIEADQVQQGVFRFLNTTRQIGIPPRWDCDGVPRLWQYNLHYFDWLWVLDFDAGRQAVMNWIGEYTGGPRRAGWEPYPISLRLMNWCGFFFGRFRSETESDQQFCQTLWESLYRQCQWLRGHLETHLLGNHYLENAAALVLLGSCFQGAVPRRWLDRGMRILSAQVQEQILPDGVHFELSPMYHCRVLYVLAMLMETEVAAVRDLLAEPVRRMAQALERLCHPDGRIALLSDSALGVYHEPKDLVSYIRERWTSLPAQSDECGCFSLPDAGYYGWWGSDGTYLIADYGKIGPEYIPGHGHADIFSFELSLNGSRVVTDSGVHDYESSDARRYCRSTAAHNTVEIEGQDQGELWGAFRLARRAYPRDVTWCADKNGFTLSGWHDGYKRLPGAPVHLRQMQWDANEGLTIRDSVAAIRPVRCVSRLHLDPACRVTDLNGRVARIAYPGGGFQVEGDNDIAAEQMRCFERFYETQARSCLCMRGEGSHVEMHYRIRIHQTPSPGSTP
jgi:uncharacterized heparinase superfamily protein